MRNLESSTAQAKTVEEQQQRRLERSFSGHAEANISGKAAYSSYNDFLKNYGSKRFGAVKADFSKNESENNEKKTVKSEIFIQVRDPTLNGKCDTTDFAATKASKVTTCKKNFELPVSKPPHHYRAYVQKSPNNQNVSTKAEQIHITKTTTHENESQNFIHNRQISPTPPKSPEIVPDDMIYAKTAVLNELMRRSSPVRDGEVDDDVMQKVNGITTTNGIPPVPTGGIPKPPPMTNGIPPPPPKFPIGINRLPPKPKLNGKIVFEREITNGFVPPPPPKFLTQQKSSSSLGSLEGNTTTIVPVVDSAANVNKSDPNVKKLVYNTYRGFLGAYNNKANDMVATLPRNMVFKDRGVNKQVESMALQGCLDKINGRVNPNADNE